MRYEIKIIIIFWANNTFSSITNYFTFDHIVENAFTCLTKVDEIEIVSAIL